MKRPYESPAIVYTEKLEVRTISPCLKNADAIEICSGAIIL